MFPALELSLPFDVTMAAEVARLLSGLVMLCCVANDKGLPFGFTSVYVFIGMLQG